MRYLETGHNQQKLSNQGGATLVLFMGILFLMLLLSVGIQDDTINQQKFTNFLKTKAIADTEARYAIRHAQTWIDTRTGAPTAINTANPNNVWASPITSTNPYGSSTIFDYSDPDNITAENYVRENHTWWVTHGTQPDANNADLRYIIEEIHHTPAGLEQQVVYNKATPTKKFYRITARSGKDPEVHSTFQATYTRTFY